MIPRVPEGGPGSSFKGAAAYYLHDKQNAFNSAAEIHASTDARVTWTATLNLATEDPEKAWRIMVATALAQNEIKKAAGLKAGKRCTNPVYSYSLSWDYSDPVDREEMLRAVKESLQVLGLADRQVLIVCHNDEPQPHVHVIVNRVHPETGRADHPLPAMTIDGVKYPPRKRELSKDHLALSRWAEAYQKRHGQEHLTPNRTKNNAAREKGAFVKDELSLSRSDYERAGGARRAEWRARKIVLEQARARRHAQLKDLHAAHAGQRDFLYNQKEAGIAALRAELKAEYRPRWAALFERHKRERQAHESAQKNLLARLHSPTRRAEADAAIEARHAKEKEALRTESRERKRAGIAAITQRYQAALEKLERNQRQELGALAAQHSAQSQALAKAIKDGVSVDELKDIAGIQVEKVVPKKPSAAMPRAPSLDPAPRPVMGAARVTKGRRRLEADRDRRIDQRLAAIRAQNRPRWAALYRRQRDEVRRYESAQASMLSRLAYHVQSHDPAHPKSVLGAALAMLGTSRDARALADRHARERRALARDIRREKETAIAREDRDHHAAIDRLEKEARREAAAYRKAVDEGRTSAPPPREKAGPAATRMNEDFRRRAEERLRQIKRDTERKKRGRDDDFGRER